MELTFLSHINYLAVAASSIIFFMLGSLWFSTLFGSVWTQELKRHNVIIKEPTKNALIMKMLLTFGANIVASFAMACLVNMTGSTTLTSGLILGIIVALGFAATTLGLVFIWESKSLKLFLIDSGYPALGIIASALLLSLWH
jgi:hypothetical protein